MISRSSIKNISQTFVYMMSKKKLTEQYRKPIQQLKKQHEENQPKPDIQKALKAGRQFLQNQNKKMGFSPQKSKFKKQSQDIEHPKEDPKKPPQPSDTQRNWLDLSQFSDRTQLLQLIKQSLHNLQNKNTKDIKPAIIKIKSKYGNQGYEMLLNSLLKKDFQKTYNLLKEEETQITKAPSRILTMMFLNMAQRQELEKLTNVFDQLEKAKTLLDFRHEEFFEILFLKETNQNVKFLTGENAVNLSHDNKILKEKIILAVKYIALLSQNNKKKKSFKKALSIPQWFNQVYRIISVHKFAVNEFRTLLTQILTKNDFILPEWFYETDNFTIMLKTFYFGEQSSLEMLLNIFEKNYRNIKFSAFYKNLTHQLMHYRIQNGSPAYEVDEVLIENYKNAFETKNKYLAIVCATIASDAKYSDLAEHYTKFYMQGFPNETLASEDLKYVQEGILNNYNRVQHAQTQQKNITKLSKGGNSTFNKIKASIKLGQLTNSWKIFEEEVYKKVVVQRQRQNIKFVLRSRLGEKSNNYVSVKQISEFMLSLTDEYLWTLYKNSQDLSVMLKSYLPEDKFSFWEEHEKKARFEHISTSVHNGQLKKLKQPSADIQADGFSMDEYLQNEYPELLQLQENAYVIRKELIRYTLRVEALQSLYKVQSDAIVIQKLNEYNQGLCEENLQILDSFGLKDYNVAEYGWATFEKRFQNMKISNYIIKDERLEFSKYERILQKNKSLTKKYIIEEMLYKTPESFQQAFQLVKLTQEAIVEKLLLWGVYTHEPMAIYLGEKLAMQTGQIIPHNLALKVSKMLSYKQVLSEQFINKCKQCLKIVGKIEREYIYSFDKQYEHIMVRRGFANFVQNYFEQRKISNQLEDLTKYTPRQQLLQKESRFFEESIKQRACLVL